MTDANEFYIDTLARICTGEDFWHTHGVPSLEIPALTLSDGPHGLRKQEEKADHLGIHDSIPAICFPSAGALACSFDRSVSRRVGELLGEECRAENIHFLLGPAMNIKRTPLNGRNFEYFSEDPYLTGELAYEYVSALQEQGVGACVKHYAANNQENGRMTLTANISERALREIYLKAFKRVMDARPRAVMSSYNRINGEYVGESRRLLTEILRDEWGFDGIVISDWYAVADRVKALKAGLDLEMPGGPLAAADKLAAAVKSGELDIKTLEECANRIAGAAKELYNSEKGEYDKERHHRAAVEIAEECAVLLKNDSGFLPLKKEERTLFVGEYALRPHIQGGGSSHINAYKTDGVTEHMTGYDCGVIDTTGMTSGDIAGIVSASERFDKVIVFAGLPDECESEGFDRKTLSLPSIYGEIIEALASAGREIGVALFHGSPVEMPWAGKVRAILTMQLAGEGAGEACADLLTGRAVPSGRLSESYPLRLEQNPSFINSASVSSVDYNEGVFIGYRYYSTKRIDTLFPFGHGLSYTEFKYDRLRVSSSDGEYIVEVDVENAGDYDAKEVVQLYIAPPRKQIDRPIIELKGFDKIFLKRGERRTVRFSLTDADLAYYDERLGRFFTEHGVYSAIIGWSAERAALSAEFEAEGEPYPVELNDNTTLSELYAHPKTSDFVAGLLAKFGGGEMNRSMALNAPLRLIKGVAKLDDDGYAAFKAKITAMLNS